MSGRRVRRVVGTGLAATGVVWLGLGLAIGGGGRALADQSRAAIAPRVTVDADRLLDVVRELASAEYEGRRTGSAGHARARAFIERRFRAAGLQPVGRRFARPFSLPPPGQWTAAAGEASPLEAGAIEGVNLVGLCPAQTPEAPYLLVGAHYDHLGTRGGVVYPGADDNASGIAVLLALAETCGHVTRRHTLLIVAFDAEELGLAGARAFVAEPAVPLDELSVMVNLDMVGRNERVELFAAGLSHAPLLAPILDRVRARAPVTLRFGHDTPGPPGYDWTQMSDHGPFHDAGVPFVYFGVEDHPDYHQPTDTADRIDTAFLRDVAITVLDAIDELDSELAPRVRSK
jgi:hypothetical protein